MAKMLNRPDPALELVPKVAPGSTYEAAVKLTIREGESLETPIIRELKRGTQVRIMEIGWINTNRAKVNADGCVGWISILDKTQHKPLMGIRRTID